jgi:hypothetical protein
MAATSNAPAESWVSKDEGAKQGKWSAPQGAERPALSVAHPADAEYRDCSCGGAAREAEWSARKSNTLRQQRALMPNPSLKPSPNGKPPGPGLGYAVHFPSPGPGVLPLVPA